MGGNNVNMATSRTGGEYSQTFKDFAEKIKGTQDKGMVGLKDRLVQQDKNGVCYSIKRHGVVRNTLVRIAVGFGAIFGFDLHKSLNCPTKARTDRAVQQFNNSMGKQESRINSVSIANIIDSYQTGNTAPELADTASKPTEAQPQTADSAPELAESLQEITPTTKPVKSVSFKDEQAPSAGSEVTNAESTARDNFAKPVLRFSPSATPPSSTETLQEGASTSINPGKSVIDAIPGDSSDKPNPPDNGLEESLIHVKGEEKGTGITDERANIGGPDVGIATEFANRPIPIEQKGKLKEYILSMDKEPTGKSAKICMRTIGYREEFMPDKNFRKVYNLVLEKIVANKENITDQQVSDGVYEHRFMLQNVRDDKSFAAELCEIDETVNSAVRRMGFITREPNEKMAETLVELFHSKLFRKQEGDKPSYAGNRKEIFESCMAKALNDLRLSSEKDYRSLVGILTTQGGIKFKHHETRESVEGVLYLVAKQDKEIVDIFRKQVLSQLFESKDGIPSSKLSELKDFSERVPEPLKASINELKGT